MIQKQKRMETQKKIIGRCPLWRQCGEKPARATVVSTTWGIILRVLNINGIIGNRKML